MTGAGEDFTFNDRQRREVAAILGEFDPTSMQGAGRVDLVQDSVREFLLRQSGAAARAERLPRNLMKSRRQQIDKLCKQILVLQTLLEQAKGPESQIPDLDDLRSNLASCLALTGPIKRRPVPFGEDQTTELRAFLRRGDLALFAIQNSLRHLFHAAKLWREYFTREPGRPANPTSDLVLYLYFACYPAGFASEFANASPAAPNSRLTRTLAVVLEALGWPTPTNLEQVIRRALERHDADEAAAADFVDRVQGFADHN